METIPDLLAKLEAAPDDEGWIELAHVVMLQLAERYRPAATAVDRLCHERDMESLDRLADIIRQRSKRLRDMLPPAR